MLLTVLLAVALYAAVAWRLHPYIERRLLAEFQRFLEEDAEHSFAADKMRTLRLAVDVGIADSVLRDLARFSAAIWPLGLAVIAAHRVARCAMASMRWARHRWRRWRLLILRWHGRLVHREPPRCVVGDASRRWGIARLRSRASGTWVHRCRGRG